MTPTHFSALLGDLHRRAVAAEQVLNAADARLGDGDTGSMLLRLIEALNNADLTAVSSIAEAADALARVAMTQTGSSLGTLVATGLTSLAKQAKAKGGNIEADELGSVLQVIRDALAARGGAATGDKTVLDSLDAISLALEKGPVTREVAVNAAKAALDDFRGLPCRIGRARMFPEKSKGADDPGMLAIALLLDDEDLLK